MGNFLRCCYRWLIITSLALGKKKCKNECDILQIFLVQGFCPLKIKITQFSGGFCLNVTVFLLKLPSVYRKIRLSNTTILQHFTTCNKMLQQNYIYFLFQHQHYKLTKSLRSSHPKPPAPITKILADSSMNSRTCGRKTKKVTTSIKINKCSFSTAFINEVKNM